jgi:hypothetical protein
MANNPKKNNPGPTVTGKLFCVRTTALTNDESALKKELSNEACSHWKEVFKVMKVEDPHFYLKTPFELTGKDIKGNRKVGIFIAVYKNELLLSASTSKGKDFFFELVDECYSLVTIDNPTMGVGRKGQPRAVFTKIAPDARKLYRWRKGADDLMENLTKTVYTNPDGSENPKFYLSMDDVEEVNMTQVALGSNPTRPEDLLNNENLNNDDSTEDSFDLHLNNTTLRDLAAIWWAKPISHKEEVNKFIRRNFNGFNN